MSLLLGLYLPRVHRETQTLRLFEPSAGKLTQMVKKKMAFVVLRILLWARNF